MTPGPWYRITLYGKSLGVEVVLLDTWVRLGAERTVPVRLANGEEVGRLEVKHYSPDQVAAYREDMVTAEALEQRMLDELRIEAEMPPDPFDTGGESDG